MKLPVRLITLLTFITVLFLNSCSKHKDPGPIAIADPGQMIATVGDKDWKFKQPTAHLFSSTITIIAMDSALNLVGINVYASVGTGTFDVTGGSSPDADYTISTQSASGYSVNQFGQNVKVGSVQITEFDEVNHTISGSFYGKVSRLVQSGKEEVEIKGGSFTKIPYTGQAFPLPESEFTASVDGVKIVPSQGLGYVANGLTVQFSNDNNCRLILLKMPPSVIPGTYSLGDRDSDYFGDFIKNSNSYFSTSGSLTISLHNTDTKRIEGTFSFPAKLETGATTVSVTNGSFAINYQ